MKALVGAFNQEKALVGAFSVIMNLRMEFFEALVMSSLCLCSVIHKTFLRFNIAETASKSQGDIKRLKRADTAESGGGRVQSLNVHLSCVSASVCCDKGLS